MNHIRIVCSLLCLMITVPVYGVDSTLRTAARTMAESSLSDVEQTRVRFVILVRSLEQQEISSEHKQIILQHLATADIFPETVEPLTFAALIETESLNDDDFFHLISTPSDQQQAHIDDFIEDNDFESFQTILITAGEKISTLNTLILNGSSSFFRLQNTLNAEPIPAMRGAILEDIALTVQGMTAVFDQYIEKIDVLLSALNNQLGDQAQTILDSLIADGLFHILTMSVSEIEETVAGMKKLLVIGPSHRVAIQPIEGCPFEAPLNFSRKVGFIKSIVTLIMRSNAYYTVSLGGIFKVAAVGIKKELADATLDDLNIKLSDYSLFSQVYQGDHGMFGEGDLQASDQIEDLMARLDTDAEQFLEQSPMQTVCDRILSANILHNCVDEWDSERQVESVLNSIASLGIDKLFEVIADEINDTDTDTVDVRNDDIVELLHLAINFETKLLEEGLQVKILIDRTKTYLTELIDQVDRFTAELDSDALFDQTTDVVMLQGIIQAILTETGEGIETCYVESCDISNTTFEALSVDAFLDRFDIFNLLKTMDTDFITSFSESIQSIVDNKLAPAINYDHAQTAIQQNIRQGHSTVTVLSSHLPDAVQVIRNRAVDLQNIPFLGTQDGRARRSTTMLSEYEISRHFDIIKQ